MPRIHETEKSRIGSMIGASLALPRTFYVQVDTPGDDPVRLLQQGFGGRTGVGIGGDARHPGVPSGASHPWNRFALARDYSIQDNIAITGYLIKVDYLLPQFEGDTGSGRNTPWNMTFRAASIPRRLKQEFGPLKRLIGANKYRERNPAATPPDPPATHTAEIENGKIVQLIQQIAREDTGADAPIPAASMVLKRSMVDWNVANVGSIVQYKHAVNTEPFFDAQPGHVEFVDWSIDSETIPDPEVSLDRTGQRLTVTLHTFSLSFFFSFIHLDELPILHTYETPEGGLAKVFPKQGETSQPVEETFVIREKKNLDTLLGLFI